MEHPSALSQERIRIAVVDDDESVLRSVARLLRVRGYSPTTYLSAEHLLREIGRLSPHCVIADLSLPGLDGLDLQRELTQSGLSYPIVFITARGDVRTSVQAMRGGAIDFLLKPFRNEDLFDAVGRALERTRALRQTGAHDAHVRGRLSSLTQREWEVFGLIVNGLLNKQISAKLGIAERTVKIHRSRLMRKMAVRSVVELARLAERFSLSASR